MMRDWEPADPRERRRVHIEAAAIAASIAFIIGLGIWDCFG